MATRIKLRRGTSLQWSSANPVLSLGEFGYETNTARFKIGDGVTSWNELDYNEQIITLTGDASGSGNGLIQVTVHDDSHNHTTATLPNFTEDVQDVVGAMLSGNTEDGLDVTYDDETGKLNFNVDDFVVTLQGDVSGQATVTNLTDTTIDVTINADSVALGTDTTGDYVETIDGTDNQVIVTGEGTESRNVILSLPQDIHSGATPQFIGIEMPNSKIVSDSTTVLSNSVAGIVSYIDKSLHSTSEHVIQMKQGTKMTSTRVTMMWDGTDVHINEYSVIDGSDGPANVVLSAHDNGGYINLLASSPDAEFENVVIKASSTFIKA